MTEPNNVLEFYNEYFIEPFLNQLIEQYPEKTLKNKNKVILLLELAKTELVLPLATMVDPAIKPVNTDKTINALESLWKTYNAEVDLSMFSKKPGVNELAAFCAKKFDEQLLW